MAIASIDRGTAVSGRLTIEEQFTRKFATSRQLFARAAKVFPAGVTHVGRTAQPIYIDRAQGSRKWDLDGNQYIDYWVGHGSLLLGHSHPAVVEAVQRQMARATHPGASHELEIEWAELICKLVPSAEMLRFTNSGSEATLMALRLSRMFTGKRKLLKFIGHFHGWTDNLVIDSNPPYGEVEPGILSDVADTVVSIPPNDIDALKKALDDDDVACCILEPTGGHFGQVPIRGEFLRTLRELTKQAGVLLIFDEVITGFRVHPGGAQGYYNIKPDLTTMAKVLAGGLPGGAVGGRSDIIDLLAYGKSGKRYRHPGTFNGNPLSAAAGIAALKIVATGEPQRRANEVAVTSRREMNRVIAEHGVNWCVYGEFSRLNLLTDYDGSPASSDDFIPYDGDIKKLETTNPTLAKATRQALLLNGIDMQALRGMTCAAHTDEDIDRTLEAFARMIAMCKAEGLV